MKQYIKENITPLLMGFVVATYIYVMLEKISDIVIQIALINEK